MASRKYKFAEEVIEIASKLCQVHKDSLDAKTAYNHRTWQSGGADAIVDGDVSALEITAAQLGTVIECFNQFNKFMTNQDPTVRNYEEDLDLVRDDI